MTHNYSKYIHVQVTVAIGAISLILSGNPSMAAFPPANPRAELFHNGGTGNCEGCHLSHGSEDDPRASRQSTVSERNTERLRGSDPGSTCLRCHEGPTSGLPKEHYVSTSASGITEGTPPAQLTPGGDFAWLKKSYNWSPEEGRGGSRESSPGERHGHNIIAVDFNYFRDGIKGAAPGGSYPSNSLSCISCHDPHGNFRRNADGSVTSSGLPVGSSGSYKSSPVPDATQSVGTFRMLAGKGYQLKGFSSAPPFLNDPPAAVAPDSYNRKESGADTRVAYGSGMSEWCQNCHAAVHGNGYGGGTQHPAGNNARFSSEVTGNYNAYVASGNLNGNSGNSYSSLVPYEMGTDDYEVLRKTANSDGSEISGPGRGGGNPNVMCLSCHRAHASGWDSMTRWNMNADFLVVNGRYPGVDNGASSWTAQGRTSAEIQKTFYDRPVNQFASYQRSLCNKCHAKD